MHVRTQVQVNGSKPIRELVLNVKTASKRMVAASTSCIIFCVHFYSIDTYSRILCRHCKHQFCWLCRKNWDVHGYDNAACNAWKEPEPDEEKTEAKQNLEKWLFYFDRFNNHEISSRLDQELCERAEEKMLDVQNTSNLSWIEVCDDIRSDCEENVHTYCAGQIHSECRRPAYCLSSNSEVDIRNGVLPLAR